MTDLELQIELAKLVPERLEIINKAVFWKDTPFSQGDLVQDTEWLHVCWLIERGMTDGVHDQFTDIIYHIDSRIERGISASWQQRARAILKVKGKEVMKP